MHYAIGLNAVSEQTSFPVLLQPCQSNKTVIYMVGSEKHGSLHKHHKKLIKEAEIFKRLPSAASFNPNVI